MLASDYTFGNRDNFYRGDQGFYNQPLSSGYSIGSYGPSYSTGMPLSYGQTYSSGVPLSYGTGYSTGAVPISSNIGSGFSSGIPITSGASYSSGLPMSSGFMQGGRRVEGDFDKFRYIDHPEMYHLRDSNLYQGNLPGYGYSSGLGYESSYGGSSIYPREFKNKPFIAGESSYLSRDFGDMYKGKPWMGSSDIYSSRDFGREFRNKPWTGDESYISRDIGDVRYGGDLYGSRDFRSSRPIYGGESYGFRDYGSKDYGFKDYETDRAYTIPTSGVWDQSMKYENMPSQGWKRGWEMDKWGSQGIDKWGSQGFNSMDFPKVDMYEDENSCFVELDLPGYKKEFLSVDLRANEDVKQLIIKGEPGVLEGEKGINYLQKERHVRPFNRCLSLPSYVKSDEVEAKLTHGILKIKIPKGGNRNRVVIGEAQSPSPYLIKSEFSSDWKDQRALSSTQ